MFKRIGKLFKKEAQEEIVLSVQDQLDNIEPIIRKESKDGRLFLDLRIRGEYLHFSNDVKQFVLMRDVKEPVMSLVEQIVQHEIERESCSEEDKVTYVDRALDFEFCFKDVHSFDTVTNIFFGGKKYECFNSSEEELIRYALFGTFRIHEHEKRLEREIIERKEIAEIIESSIK